MIPAPDGTPWWVWALVVVVPSVVAAASAVLVVWVGNKPTRKALHAVREQVENEHGNGDHPYPNLRHQLDAIHDDLRATRQEGNQTRQDVAALRSEHRDTRGWIAAEAVERKHMAEAFDRHVEEAKGRDQLLAAHDTTLAIIQSLVNPTPPADAGDTTD